MYTPFDRAMDKLRDELAGNRENASIERIGEYMTEYLRTHPSASDQIGSKEKTLKGAFQALEDYARKQSRKGNCVAIDPQTAFRIVLEYYGIGEAAPETKRIDDELDLDALLNL